MQPCSSGCIHVYIGIMTSEYSCNISEHVVWWLGNETVALLQSHPNEALALLQRHPKQNGTLTAPVLMALLQRQYWWHSYSASTNGTLTAPIQSRLTGTLTVPTLSAGTLTVPRVSMAPPARSGKSCLRGSCKIRCDMWLVFETSLNWTSNMDFEEDHLTTCQTQTVA